MTGYPNLTNDQLDAQILISVKHRPGSRLSDIGRYISAPNERIRRRLRIMVRQGKLKDEYIIQGWFCYYVYWVPA